MNNHLATPQNPDSVELYLACISDDPLIQEEGYQRLSRYLFRVALHMTQSRVDGEQFAFDAVQYALERIYQRILECKEPKAFKSWSRRITTNWIIDQFRKEKRTVPLDTALDVAGDAPLLKGDFDTEGVVLSRLKVAELRDLINKAPISDRSKRVIIGRFLDDLDDESLSAAESMLSGAVVRPDNIQVTRAKNFSKLRNWPYLKLFFDR